MSTLADDLAAVLNKHCAENAANTPDFILAEFLIGSLEAWNQGTNRREEWYGVYLEPGSDGTRAARNAQEAVRNG
jgi:hypothetical protein